MSSRCASLTSRIPRRADQRPGVVDEHVDRPELRGGAIHERPDLVRAAHVGAHRDSRAAGRHDPIAGRLGPRFVAVVADRHARPEIRQRHGRRRADAGRSAGDQSDASSQIQTGLKCQMPISSFPTGYSKRQPDLADGFVVLAFRPAHGQPPTSLGRPEGRRDMAPAGLTVATT